MTSLFLEVWRFFVPGAAFKTVIQVSPEVAAPEILTPNRGRNEDFGVTVQEVTAGATYSTAGSANQHEPDCTGHYERNDNVAVLGGLQC
jgi:hypothetical protein